MVKSEGELIWKRLKTSNAKPVKVEIIIVLRISLMPFGVADVVITINIRVKTISLH